MDFKKEIELYKKYRDSKLNHFGLRLSDFKAMEEYLGCLTWLNAKSQAVPEGFVVVPRELSADEARKHAEAMFNKFERMARNEQRDLSESEFELFKNRWIDARTLTIQFDWKAMIEAQEQSQ